MEITVASMQSRRKAAMSEKAAFQPLLDDVYEYGIPYRRGVSQSGKGEKRTNRVFDHTAIVSAFRGANRLAQDIAPAGQQFFSLTPGPLARATMQPDQQKEMAAQLEVIQLIVGAHFQTGEWDAALAEMCLDVMASTGCMLIDADKRGMSRFIAVPLDEVLLTSNGYNEVNGIFWERKWNLQALADEFGTEKFSEDLKKQLQEKPEAEICLYQDTVFDVKADRWVRIACIKEGNDKAGIELKRGETRTCPWLTPRHFKVPGETYGRGPLMLVMPTVKALNTGKKLTLQGAAIAMLGVYTAIDDGVFSPDNFLLAPGAVNKVARNGGSLGPSIMRFPDPRMDLTQLIFKDMAMEIQMGMNDNQLPPDTAAVRSATEVLERVKRIAGDHMGAYGRMIMEIVVPAVKRVMEIAYEAKQLPNTVDIDRMFVDVQVASPMALAREAERMQKLTQYVDLALMMVQAKQAGVDRYVKLDVMVPEIARSMAIPERMLPSDKERAAMDEQAAQQQAAMMAAEAAMKNPEMAQQAMAA
jgi:Bacteriophage head to tail connecting protein